MKLTLFEIMLFVMGLSALFGVMAAYARFVASVGL